MGNKEARGWRVLAGCRVSSFQFVFIQGVSFPLPLLTLTSPYPLGVRLRIKPLLSFGERCCDGGFGPPAVKPHPLTLPLVCAGVLPPLLKQLTTVPNFGFSCNVRFGLTLRCCRRLYPRLLIKTHISHTMRLSFRRCSSEERDLGVD